jgi:hypothetical protein
MRMLLRRRHASLGGRRREGNSLGGLGHSLRSIMERSMLEESYHPDQFCWGGVVHTSGGVWSTFFEGVGSTFGVCFS